MPKLFVEVLRNNTYLDKKTGRQETNDVFFTKVNAIKVKLILKGTAYDAVSDALERNQKLEIVHHDVTFENQQTQKSFTSDSLFIMVDGEEVPCKADAYGKRLIIKALETK